MSRNGRRSCGAAMRTARTVEAVPRVKTMHRMPPTISNRTTSMRPPVAILVRDSGVCGSPNRISLFAFRLFTRDSPWRFYNPVPTFLTIVFRRKQAVKLIGGPIHATARFFFLPTRLLKFLGASGDMLKGSLCRTHIFEKRPLGPVMEYRDRISPIQAKMEARAFFVAAGPIGKMDEENLGW